MKRIYLLGLLCMLLIVSGCATIHITKTVKGHFAATNPNEVEILMITPERKFTELAMVITTRWQPGNLPKMFNSLRAKCAPLGADAVILISSGVDGGGYCWMSGVAISYKDQ